MSQTEEDYIIQRYQPCLQSIGVDFERVDIDEHLKTCSCDLENKLRAIIAWYIYLLANNKHLPDPNQIFIQAFREQWQPRYWQDKYLHQLTTPGADSVITHRVRQKLNSLSFFKGVVYQIESRPLSVCFYENHAGENRKIWQINIDDFFSLSPQNLIYRYLDKSNVRGEEYLAQLEQIQQSSITYEEF